MHEAGFPVGFRIFSLLLSTRIGHAAVADESSTFKLKLPPDLTCTCQTYVYPPLGNREKYTVIAHAVTTPYNSGE